MEALIEGLIEIFGEIILNIIAAIIGAFFDYMKVIIFQHVSTFSPKAFKFCEYHLEHHLVGIIFVVGKYLDSVF